MIDNAAFGSNSVETDQQPALLNARAEGSSVNAPLGRLLIFIVAYNAENTIENVLKRIPPSLAEQYEVEILIIDDSSQDNTFERSELVKRSGTIPFKMTVLFNPVNQGYGGNQKLGFRYAVSNNFDYVALVHGDGQYAPECLPDLVRVLAHKEADAVFGSRMMHGNSALKGGMPLYKFVGNKILTTFQNFLLQSHLSEFHSGYRLYSIPALKKIPFDLNSNDFHFDTEIIIQLITAKLSIKELSIPTFYGDEICHVNGMKYAWDVCRATMQARVQKYHIFFDRKFDCAPEGDDDAEHLVYDESGAEAVFARSLDQRSNILVMGKASSGLIAALEAKNHTVTVQPAGLVNSQLASCEDVDYLVIFDDTELSQRPDQLIQLLKDAYCGNPGLKVVLSVGNIGFILPRILLMLGRFSYTKRGIINFGHFHFFTLRSLKNLFQQNNFEVVKVAGVPIQYRRIFKSKALCSIFTEIHNLLIAVRPSVFAYQFLIIFKAKPSLDYLLTSAMRISSEKQSKISTNPSSVP
ncbi:MAG: bifunctional glycosyltransferase/class I SAM-dependent methyltransferase [Desulforhopalus sp.]|nr:bifunctional glycosyltransferase/class I SAM-dependent methyltransferase [Desulforhopalus sp.]